MTNKKSRLVENIEERNNENQVYKSEISDKKN